MSDNITERDLHNKYHQIVKAFQDGQRKERLMGYIFKFLILAYLFVTTYTYMFMFGFGSDNAAKEKHIAIINIEGGIGSGQQVDASVIVPSIKKAFENENSVAIVLQSNSPGGSPAHSDKIHTELQYYKSKYPEKKLYATVGDVCASGCYYIATAADEILVNKTSMLGSIGVKAQHFGYTEIMNKLGVERRSISVGDHKTFMDPFSDRDLEAEHAFRDSVLVKTHERFKEVVRTTRGEKLDKAEGVDLFNGLVWSGEDAVELGLADGLGNVFELSRTIDGIEEGAMHNYTTVPFSFKRMIMGAAVEVIQSLSEGPGVGYEL